MWAGAKGRKERGEPGAAAQRALELKGQVTNMSGLYTEEQPSPPDWRVWGRWTRRTLYQVGAEGC